jgi:glutathione S-transferase
MALTLYSDGFYISPYAFSVFVALEEKGVPYRLELVPLHEKAHQRPQYRDGSVTGRVPAIDHDGFWLAESSAIIEYLDEAFSEVRVLPKDMKSRARARMVMAWIRSDMLPIREERPTTTMFYERAQRPLSAAAQTAAARLIDGAMRLCPDGAATLFGGWSIADSDLAFMLQRLGLNGHELPAKLRAFVDAQWSRASVQKWVQQERAPYQPY